MLGRFASHEGLSFTWYDAAVLSRKIRQESHKQYDSSSRFDLPLPSDSGDSLDDHGDSLDGFFD